MRAAAADAETSNKRVSVFATTPHKHTQILNKAPRHRGRCDRGCHLVLVLVAVEHLYTRVTGSPGPKARAR